MKEKRCVVADEGAEQLALFRGIGLFSASK